MRDFISLSAVGRRAIFDIFSVADEIRQGKHRDALKGKCVVLFFPESSIRTRVTFEKGIFQLGGQSVLFPNTALDKKEDLCDVCGYLDNWADLIVVRHRSLQLIERMAGFSAAPVVNAMTEENHPCEILSDLYALSGCRADFTKDRYLFCGTDGNIGRTWLEASSVIGFDLSQCCAAGYAMPGIDVYCDIDDAVKGKDIICTDSLPSELLSRFERCRVTRAAMEKANKGALLNPCPPFFREEEVSADAIGSDFFAGYDFKKCLLEVQQAILLYCLGIVCD